MYIEIGEYREAMNYAQQYIKCAPKDYKGYKILGLLHEKTGSVKEALKAYRRYLRNVELIISLYMTITVQFTVVYCRFQTIFYHQIQNNE